MDDFEGLNSDLTKFCGILVSYVCQLFIVWGVVLFRLPLSRWAIQANHIEVRLEGASWMNRLDVSIVTK